ncbi:MAG: HNH endonuclease [Pseudomonadota bacterium]
MTREVPLTCGRVALIDEADWPLVEGSTWRSIRAGSKGRTLYAVTKRAGRQITMHQLIMPVQPPLEVDHRNRDGLDNRRANLRPATHQQNTCNRSYTRAAPGYRGARFKRGRWQAIVVRDARQLHLGSFGSEVEAAVAYDLAAVALHGDFASPNFDPSRDWVFPFLTDDFRAAVMRRAGVV